ncbi:hypothetical protein EJB05_02021, partial [Eragrostis curvula]
MAATSPVFIEEDQDPPMMFDWMAMEYQGSSGHAHFHSSVVPSSVQTSGDQLTGVPIDMNDSHVARQGMIPAGFEMPGGAHGVTNIGAVGGISGEAVTAWKTQTGSYSKPPTPLIKAPWTEAEDSKLKEWVEHHGEQKWSVIAGLLPRRAGKQCRERWINHLRPDIKGGVNCAMHYPSLLAISFDFDRHMLIFVAKSSQKNELWTEDEDKILIEAHRCYGNRWSMIAKHLSGRSENAIKNHWNATLRSLNAKRRHTKKKSEPVQSGRFSILEEYIRSAPPSSSAPPPHNLAYNGLNSVVHTSASNSIPTNPEMSFFNAANSVAGSSNLGMVNLNMTPPPDMNDVSDPQLQEFYLNYHMYVPAPAPLLEQATDHQDPQQAYSSLNMFPYTDYFALLRSETGRFDAGSSSNNPGTDDYNGDAGRGSAGGSGSPAGDTNEMVELASREFFTPSKNQVTLDFTKFK